MDEDVDAEVKGMTCKAEGTEVKAGFKSKAMSCAVVRRLRKSLLLVAVVLGATVLNAGTVV